jgi:predicted nucleotidyltransferase component of viral defense system
MMALNQSRHKVLLIEILKDIFTDPKLSTLLGFKGGTAAFLFHGLDRFSVDLDFDLLDQSQTNTVFDELKTLLASYGKLKQSDIKRYSLIFILDYSGKVEGDQNVKVEVNLRNFGSMYENKHYLGIPMRVMVPRDMIAHKLIASYERIGKANRDLYDSFFFLSQHWEINWEIIESRTGMSYLEFMKLLLQSVEKISNRSILAGLGEVLDEKKKHWVKNHLRDELIFQLRILIDAVEELQ